MRNNSAVADGDKFFSESLGGRDEYYSVSCIRVLIAVGAVSLTLSVIAQDLVLSYAGSIGGANHMRSSSIEVDSSGNTIIAGHFSGSVDLDPGPGIFVATSVGDYDIFVCKLDSAGEFLWGRTMGGLQNDQCNAIAVDGSDNIYSTGRFEGTADFDPGLGVENLTSSGEREIFVSKLDSNGDFQWAISVGGSNRDEGNGISVDSDGNVYGTGLFEGTADFDPGSGVHSLTSSGGWDAYVHKLNSSGEYQWAVAVGNFSDDWGNDIAVDATGSIYYTGKFGWMVDFDPGIGVSVLSSVGLADVFVCKLDASGAFQWARSMGGTNDDVGNGIAVDLYGNAYVTGSFQRMADFDPGPSVTTLSASGFLDVFVCKLDAAGTLQWAGAFGGTSNDSGRDICVDSSGDVYVTGNYRDTADFDPGIGVIEVSSSGGEDIFILRLNASGETAWVGSMGSNSSLDYGIDVALDSAGGVVGTGWFGGTADFDPSTRTHYLINGAGVSDSFVLKLEPQSVPVAGNDAGIAYADQVLTTLASPISSSLLANDVDANALATLDVTIHDASSVLGAAVLVNPDGTFIYDPTAVPLFQALAAGDSLVDSFTYTVSDGTDSVIGIVTITVYGAGTTLPALSKWALFILCVGLAVARRATNAKQNATAR